MIKLFSKIRKNLLAKGKTTRYFKYAIGEIILVVIGILIALYVNNKQQEHIIQKQQENYLRLIKGEMISNLKSLAIEKDQLSEKTNNAIKVLNIMNNDSLVTNLTETEISQLINNFLISDIFLNYENGALNQIIYSGGLKDIRNDSISGLLASWEGKVNRVRLQENQVAKAQENLLSYLYKNGDFRILADDLGYSEKLGVDLSLRKKGNKNLLQSKEYENSVFQFIGFGYSLQNQDYPNFENELKSLISLIDQELNN